MNYSIDSNDQFMHKTVLEIHTRRRDACTPILHTRVFIVTDDMQLQKHPTHKKFGRRITLVNRDV